MEKIIPEQFPLFNPEISGLDPEVRALYEFAERAKISERSEASYQSDWTQFYRWCRIKKKMAFPVKPETIAQYIHEIAIKQKRKFSTVRRRITTIAMAHRNMGVSEDDLPTTKHIVRITLKGIKNTIGSQKKGKAPLLVEQLKAVISEIDTDTLVGKRDKTIILLGFATSLRRKDIAKIQAEDISRVPEGLVIHVTGEKQDRAKKGRNVAVPFGKYEETCPVVTLCKWLEASQISKGPIFRSFTRFDRPRQDQLSGQSVALIVKKYCTLAGIPAANFAGHSLRAGLVTSSIKAGAKEHDIRRHTDQSPQTVKAYIRETRIFVDHVFKKLDL